MRGINLADDTVYRTLTMLFEAACYLLNSHQGDATERVIGLFAKLYKIQTHITHTLVALKVTVLPPLYILLADYISQHCSYKMETFLIGTHSEKERANTVQKIKKQGKVVPELIYHMEQLDVELISLSKTVLDRSTVTKFIKPSAARDFRFRPHEEGDEEEGTGRKKGNASDKKRKDGRESGGANKKSKGRNRDDEE
jgi:hypothetical protein